MKCPGAPKKSKNPNTKGKRLSRKYRKFMGKSFNRALTEILADGVTTPVRTDLKRKCPNAPRKVRPSESLNSARISLKF